MNSIWFTLFFCLICFILGFAYATYTWINNSKSGQPFELGGKVYKIIELKVVEKGGSND